MLRSIPDVTPRLYLYEQHRKRTNEVPMRYYVNDNAQSNGDHEVHTSSCSFVPSPANRTYLGDFTSCPPAVREARKHYRQVNGCYYCSRACHTS